MATHEKYMQRCLQLAEKGLGSVSPNPMVGAVIVHNDKIIGEGFHRKFGEAHAEVNAINNVEDHELLKEATLYVNLEPCSHYGKTPPCSDLIIEKKIPKVVIANLDPYDQVNGSGVEKLKQAGVEVITGVEAEKGAHLNRRFFIFHQKQRPYIVLKWAESRDGLMDVERSEGDKGVYWISHPNTKKLVHKWRSEEAAVMVGANTAQNDNSALTVREITGRQPLRILIDPNERVSHENRIFDGSVPTIIFGKANRTHGNTEWITINDKSSLVPEMLRTLHKRGVQSILVEGGAITLTEFIRAGCWDEARKITGDVHLLKGKKAPHPGVKPTESYNFGTDLIEIFYRQ
ncbi:bifunctional diaminohydroxyphosphoribosylaminopyrimidine deaminase/5-amino-6-(5-phosphoribosylamino)uracil reductase RibD [Halocola ammonii]